MVAVMTLYVAIEFDCIKDKVGATIVTATESVYDYTCIPSTILDLVNIRLDALSHLNNH